MKKRPRILNYFSLSFLLLSALSIFEIYFERQIFAINTIQFHTWAFLILGLWGAVCAWQASAMLFAIVVSLWSFVIEGTLSVFRESVYFHQLVIFVATAAIIFLQTLWFWISFRNLVLQPSRHWWKNPSRVRVGFKAIVRTSCGTCFVADVSNLSRDGMLIGLRSPTGHACLNVGEPMKIHFVLDRYSYVKCSAEIVRQHKMPINTAAPIPYYGMRITGIGLRSLKNIQKFVSENRQESQG